MSKKQEKIREDRIYNEIIVDCYDEYEQMAGWYCYLEDHLPFPFTARCSHTRSISLLKKGEEVMVTGMAPSEDCEAEMTVLVKWSGRTFGVPLEQLSPIGVDERVKEMVEDWKYWKR